MRRVVSLIGTASPRPMPATAVLIPTTRPSPSASAPPGVAGVQRGVGLHDVLDQPLGAARADRQRAAERADDARGHAAAEAARVADGDDQLADPQVAGVAERGGVEVAAYPRAAPQGR